jgi:hypothetical protein
MALKMHLWHETYDIKAEKVKTLNCSVGSLWIECWPGGGRSLPSSWRLLVLPGGMLLAWWIPSRPRPKACLECTHHVWVYPLDPGIQTFSRGNVPQYTKLCLPLGVLRVLAQLRIECSQVGWADLEVQQRRLEVPREACLCRLCSRDGAPLSARLS